MKLVPNEKEQSVIERVSDKLGIDYGEIELEDLFVMIQDLMVEIGKLEEELEDEKQDKRENYKPRDVDYYEEYGVSESDFH